MKQWMKKYWKNTSGILFGVFLILALAGTAFAGTSFDDPLSGRENGQVLDEFYEGSGVSMQSVNECGTQWNDTMYFHNLSMRPYLKNQENKIQKGIDVSSYEGNIDWNLVKQDEENISFVIVRAGFRGWGEAGTLKADSCFEDHIKGALQQGFSCGVYFFSQAISVKEAEEEADYVLMQLRESGISPEDLKLPVFLDVEFDGNREGRLYTAKLSKQEQTEICNAFIGKIEAVGYRAGVYANKSMFESNMNAEDLSSSAAVWLANYNQSTSYGGNYSYWQCSESGTVDGISSDVDLNFYYEPVFTANYYGDASTLPVKKNASSDKISIKWNVVEGASSYKIFRSEIWNGTYSEIEELSTNEYTDSGLQAGREYYYRVMPIFISDGERVSGRISNMCPVYTTKTYWNRKTTEAVRLRLYAGVDSRTLCTMPAGKELKIYAVGKGSNGKDWYKVQYGSYTGYVLGSYTNPYTSTVSGLKMSSYNSSAIKISWTKAPYADGYVVYRSTSKSGSYRPVKTIYSQNTLTFTDTQLKAGAAYYYKVKAFSKENNQPYYGAESAVLTAATKVSKPTGVKQYGTAKTSITVTWKKVYGASGYQIYRSTAKNGKYSKVKTITSGNTLKWKDERKSSGTEYYYKIRAYKSVGGMNRNGDFTSAVTLHTKMASKLTVKTKAAVNLRSSAGTAYSKKITVPKNKTFTVLYKTKDKSGKTWYKIKYTVKKKSYTGYIIASATKK
ncbi:MAG: SH3 domain-containing protein [Emergencia sp.]|nr:SH3 domain-containing protein [Emergencia sp.]